MQGPAYKQPSSIIGSEFQQAPKVDEGLQYVPKKAVAEITLTPKNPEHRQAAVLILDTLHFIADIHDDRAQKGVMKWLSLG